MRQLCLWLCFMLAAPLAAENLTLLSRSSSEHIQVQLAAAEQAWLIKRSKLVFGTIAVPHPPFSLFSESGDFEGLTADYLGLISHVTGLDIIVKKYPDKVGLIAALKQGEIDFFSYSRGRNINVPGILSSEAYADDIPVLVSEKRSSVSAKKTTNDGKLRLAFPSHYLSAWRLQQAFPNTELLPFNNQVQGVEAVAFGQADLYIGNAISAHYLIHVNNFSELQIDNFTPLESGSYNFYVQQQNQPLLTLINTLLQAVPVKQKQNIVQRWSAGRPLLMLDQPLNLSEDERAYIQRRPVAKVAYLAQQAPFSYESNGRVKGIISAVAEVITAKTGLEIQWVKVNSLEEALRLLQEGEVDLSGFFAPTPQRQEYLTFSRPYLVTSYGVITKVGRERSNWTLEDLNGKKVAVISGYSLSDYLTKFYPQIEQYPLQTAELTLQAVVDGKADATLHDLVTSRFYLKHAYRGKLQLTSGFRQSEARFTFSTSRHNHELISMVDKALLSIPPDRLAMITTEWVSKAGIQLSFWQTYRSGIIKTVAVALLLVAGFVLWNLYLRHQVRERQRLLEQVQQAQAAADQANKAKTAFLANMSHEIRTPLHAIIGTLELARRNACQNIWDYEALDIAFDSAQGLKELLGDILDIAKIESGKFELQVESTDLKKEIKRLYQVFIGQAREQGLYLKLELEQLPDNFFVSVDPGKFKQILANLLGNAIKFTNKGGVTLAATMQEVQQVAEAQHRTAAEVDLILCIKDTGVGIAKNELAKLMQPFSQVSSAKSSSQRGSGLGLNICAGLVSKMRGQIQLQSNEGQGTEVTVRLRLPLAEKPAALAMEATQQQAAALIPLQVNALRVLVVDDHSVNRMLLARQLEYLGYKVVQAEHGAQALEKLQQQTPDLVITDCNMPVMDGYEFTRQIRLAPGLQGLTVIGLTARAEQDEAQRCAAAGMDKCLFKPISMEQLQLALGQLRPSKALAFEPAKLKQLADNDMQFCQLMLQELVKANSQDLAVLTELINTHNTDGIRQLAHKIKGAAMLINAAALVTLCEQLELAADDKVTQLAPQLSARLTEFNADAGQWLAATDKGMTADETSQGSDS